jgi:hypothetical protein
MKGPDPERGGGEGARPAAHGRICRLTWLVGHTHNDCIRKHRVVGPACGVLAFVLNLAVGWVHPASCQVVKRRQQFHVIVSVAVLPRFMQRRLTRFKRPPSGVARLHVG